MPFKSKAQQRWMFAAESRGELPKGKASEWAHETKNIKGLPEHVSDKKKKKHMKKEGMFFENRDPEASQDGMFFKHAQDEGKLNLPKVPEKPKLPVEQSKPKDALSRSWENTPKPGPTQAPKPEAQMGHGCMLSKKGMLGIPATEPADTGNIKTEMGAGKRLPDMGTGGKLPELSKKADANEIWEKAKSGASEVGSALGGAASRVGKTLGTMGEHAGKALSDVPGMAERGLSKLEELTPLQSLALLAGGGFLGLKGAGKLVRGAGRALRPAQKPVGVAGRLGSAWRALRGK